MEQVVIERDQWLAMFGQVTTQTEVTSHAESMARHEQEQALKAHDAALRAEIDALRKVCETLEGDVDATAVVVDWGEGTSGNLRLTVTCPSVMDEEQIGQFIASNVNLLYSAAEALEPADPHQGGDRE